VVVARVDPTTGALARAYCPVTAEGVFPKGMEPTEECPYHKTPAAARAADLALPQPPDQLTNPTD
jgi:hypothetical protein